MPLVNWDSFSRLPGSVTTNFENLCRGIVLQHYGKYGHFGALANQPGVEFHLKLHADCPLGGAGRWFGWQCRWYELASGKAIGSTRRQKIAKALAATLAELPELTDWVLWTRHPLTKADQKWFHSLTTKIRLRLLTAIDAENLLNGSALILRQTYFGELVLTPDDLALLHTASTARICARWMPQVHQSVTAERVVRQMLGDAKSWEPLRRTAEALSDAAKSLNQAIASLPSPFLEQARVVLETARSMAKTIDSTYDFLSKGQVGLLQRGLNSSPKVPHLIISRVLSQMRAMRLSASLFFTNLAADIKLGARQLVDTSDLLGKRIVAVVAGAGGGKTQLSAELTAPTATRVAGLLLHGQDLHANQGMDDLARRVVIQASPVQTMEALLAAVHAVGERSGQRIPIVIDGLNEAEDPRAWKPILAELAERLRAFPYVMVVCTVRTEEFADETLPDSVERLEIPNFAGDTDEAIRKYFEYYKIDPADADIPTEWLSTPLNLKLFCEVTNSERVRQVGIEAIPQSQTTLFAKYLDNVGDRISQLSTAARRYFAQDVRRAIQQFGIMAWENRSRAVDEMTYRKRIGDDSLPWDKSILRALEQEGVFLRMSVQQVDGRGLLRRYPAHFHGSGGDGSDRRTNVGALYDALAGHIIAEALLLEYGNSRVEAWLRDEQTQSLLNFVSDSPHPLASDIIRSLAGLAPRRLRGQQLWQMLGSPTRLPALYEAAKLEPAYIDRGTVQELEAIAKSGEEFHQVAAQLWRLRGAVRHPLNAGFLDSVLRTMSMADRDLRWTDWVSRNRHSIHSDLVVLESHWRKRLERTPESALRVQWVMWTLTSVVRSLRDQATRTLYWFARGDPAALFELTLDSLKINDLYVRERMLAASYGVAMAYRRRCPIPGFRHEALPKFAKRLFDLMFAEGAPHPTSHILARDYARHILNLALLDSPKLLSSSDRQRVYPPFPGLPKLSWGSEPVNEGGYGGPIGMDFANYTIGRLVEDRANYDFQHSEYQQVVGAVRWRIKDLGYDEARFGSAEERRAQGHREYGRVEPEGKIDRYGKKYAWIAFFEKAGERAAEGKLRAWYEENGRVSDVDIEPSFPDPSPLRSIVANTLPFKPESLSAWLKLKGSAPVRPLLLTSSFRNAPGAWVLLAGFYHQRDGEKQKALVCQIRNLMMSTSVMNKLEEIRKRGETIQFMHLPMPSLTYTFVGEAGWADTFPETGRVSLEVHTGTETVTAPACDFGLGAPDSPRTWERPITRSLNIYVPVVDNGWESYHSTANAGDYPPLLSREICVTLGLSVDTQTSEFYDNNGDLASMIVKQGREEGAAQEFVYLRQDLFDRFLKIKRRRSLWVVWGERDLYSKSNAVLEKLYSRHGRPEPFEDIIRYEDIKRTS